MPHFLCPRCAFVGYSAAGEIDCPTCGAPLRRDNQLRPVIPHAESIDIESTSAPAGAGRFVRDTPTGIPEGSLE
jgi:uncharacterized Zn finger protein (UPF0148 family)